MTEQGAYCLEFMLDMFLLPVSLMLGDVFASDLGDIGLLLETMQRHCMY